MFLAAVLLPQAANAVFLLARGEFPFDPSPVVFTAALFALSVAIFRYGFLDIAPAARREALRHSPEALLLMDTRGRAAAWNERFRSTLFAGRLRPRAGGGPVEEFCRGSPTRPPVPGLSPASGSSEPRDGRSCPVSAS